MKVKKERRSEVKEENINGEKNEKRWREKDQGKKKEQLMRMCGREKEKRASAWCLCKRTGNTGWDPDHCSLRSPDHSLKGKQKMLEGASRCVQVFVGRAKWTTRATCSSLRLFLSRRNKHNRTWESSSSATNPSLANISVTKDFFPPSEAIGSRHMQSDVDWPKGFWPWRRGVCVVALQCVIFHTDCVQIWHPVAAPTQMSPWGRKQTEERKKKKRRGRSKWTNQSNEKNRHPRGEKG